MFKACIPDIPKNEKIVVPISMNQRLQKGQSLSATLRAIEVCGYKEMTTILVCDYLDRFNTDEEESIRKGNKFLEDHKPSLEGFTVIRWKEFLNSRDQETLCSQIKKIEEASKEGTRFYVKMRSTWKKLGNQSENLLKNSIKYQIEEYATILCMDDFNHLLYPQKMSDGMFFLYNFIEGRKPHYHQIKVSDLKNQNEISPMTQQFSFLQSGASKKRHHMHIAFRAVLQQMETLLDSDELSIDSKKVFVDEVGKLFLSYGLIFSEPRLNSEVEPILKHDRSIGFLS